MCDLFVTYCVVLCSVCVRCCACVLVAKTYVCVFRCDVLFRGVWPAVCVVLCLCACWLYVFVCFVCDRLCDVEWFVVEWLIVFARFRKNMCFVRAVWELLYIVVWFGVCLCCLGGSMWLCVLFGKSCLLLYGLVFVCVAWGVQ